MSSFCSVAMLSNAVPCGPNMAATLRAFRATFYSRLSDWLMPLEWLATKNPLLVVFKQTDKQTSVGVSAETVSDDLSGGCNIGEPVLVNKAGGGFAFSTCYTNKNCRDGFYCSTALLDVSARCCRSDSGKLVCLSMIKSKMIEALPSPPPHTHTHTSRSGELPTQKLNSICWEHRA